MASGDNNNIATSSNVFLVSEALDEIFCDKEFRDFGDSDTDELYGQVS